MVRFRDAGGQAVVPAEEQDPRSFADIVSVNLIALFALTRAVAPGMLDRGGGSIVNIASVYGLVGSGSLTL